MLTIYLYVYVAVYNLVAVMAPRVSSIGPLV